MTDHEFWALITAAGHAPDPTGALTDLLTDRPADDCVEFDGRLHALLRRAWRPDLWDLADLVLGTVADADFEYFRLWLVFQGRDAFEAVLADPDRLADLVPTAGPGSGDDDAGGFQLDGPQYVAWRVYRSRTGEHMPARRRPPAPLHVVGAAPSGTPAERFPRTWRHLSGPR